MLDLDIQGFDPKAAAEADFIPVNAFDNKMKAESWAEDPPDSLRQTIRNRRSAPEFYISRQWFARLVPGGEVIAAASVGFADRPENRHIANFWIGVLPHLRRRGIAKRLLSAIADFARQSGRPLLLTSTISSVPEGDLFVKRLGAQLGMAAYTNQLRVSDVDQGLIEAWRARGSNLAADFELGLWVGRYPESDLEAIADLETVMNTAPRDNLDVEDLRPSPALLRQIEESYFARDIERWTMYVRERAAGRLAGYTEVFWSPHLPAILSQGDTGVFPEYRNRGLGSWLKAEMLNKVIAERPQVQLVRTGNARSNAPMLHINEALGFRPYRSVNSWQVPLDQVLEYLK